MLDCAGVIPTLETVAAAHWLRENSPELKVSVVNVVDLMTLFPREFHPYGSRPGDRAPTLMSECEAAIARAIAYSREHFEYPPEIRNWTWTS